MNADKTTIGLRKLKDADNHSLKVEKLLEIVANQNVQIKNMSLILLVYIQSSDFDVDIAQMLNKMGKGEEALKQMFKNKLKA